MTDKSIEQKVKQSFSGLAPDTLPADVVAACVTPDEKSKSNVRPLRWFSAAVAVAAVVLVMVGINIFKPLQPAAPLTDTAVSTTISLDVNPSVDIEVDASETVLSVTPLNEDGKEIVGDTDYTGTALDATVSSLVLAMIDNGYLNEMANSMLISINSDDADLATRLQAELSAEVDSLLTTGDFEGSILSQIVPVNSNLETLAAEYNISQGKALLINRMIERDPLKTFDALAPLSINELNLLAANLDTDVAVSGTASDKAYIGGEEAKAAAFTHAGLAADTVTNAQVELDCEDGVMCYEVEFFCNGTEYEYEIDAVTGEILDYEQEIDDEDNDEDDDDDDEAPSVDPATLDPDAAKAAAFTHAGVSEANITDFDMDLKTKNGVMYYDIDFEYNGAEYDYKVNVETNEVTDCKTEVDDDDVDGDNDDNDDDDVVFEEGTYIDEATAKAAAFTHAGVNEADVTKLDCELDREDGAVVYEIEWEIGTAEYEYRIDAVSGEILKNQQETDD